MLKYSSRYRLNGGVEMLNIEGLQGIGCGLATELCFDLAGNVSVNSLKNGLANTI